MTEWPSTTNHENHSFSSVPTSTARGHFFLYYNHTHAFFLYRIVSSNPFRLLSVFPTLCQLDTQVSGINEMTPMSPQHSGRAEIIIVQLSTFSTSSWLEGEEKRRWEMGFGIHIIRLRSDWWRCLCPRGRVQWGLLSIENWLLWKYLRLRLTDSMLRSTHDKISWLPVASSHFAHLFHILSTVIYLST